MERMKYPLSIFVVWHPDFYHGMTIANDIYSQFCRDIKSPLSRGIGIPVYFRYSLYDGIPVTIDTKLASKNAIVLLIEQNFYVDENFRAYVKLLTELVDQNTRIFPISLYDKAYSIGNGLEAYQFIKAYQGNLAIEKNFDYSIKKIKSELLHDVARLLLDMQPTWTDKNEVRPNAPAKLFLSHAKKDGEEITKRFKAFIEENLKLDIFFDAVDIADGFSFEEQIKNNIQNSALVVFHTDEYSAREWCRIEVLIAKKNKCSIVVVHNIKKGEKRAFPYMGNMPTIAFQYDERNNFYEIVNLTLTQIVNNLYQKELLKSFVYLYKVKGIEFITIATPPELFNYIDILKKKEASKDKLVVLYPEPPLGSEEVSVLNEIDKEILFLTPILLPSLM